jgi:hypothetical protein
MLEKEFKENDCFIFIFSISYLYEIKSQFLDKYLKMKDIYFHIFLFQKSQKAIFVSTKKLTSSNCLIQFNVLVRKKISPKSNA